ncbi:MAG: transposase [Bdellovibrionaceae bacterium]|nr:transposase [Pseudobdellovibrionaceae bacterium]
MEKVWDIFCSELSETSEKHELKIHSFILMSNHFHLIASTPHANISQCMQHFMGRASRKLTTQGNRINETFAGRHYKCVLQKPNYYLNAYKYNYRNPVAAGICKKVEDYSFSTLQFTMKLSSSKIPMVEDTTFNFDPLGTLKWLNETPEVGKLEAVRNGMKHSFFKSKKNRKSGLPFIRECDLL